MHSDNQRTAQIVGRHMRAMMNELIEAKKIPGNQASVGVNFSEDCPLISDPDNEGQQIPGPFVSFDIKVTSDVTLPALVAVNG